MAFLSQFATDSTGIDAPETSWNLFRVPEIDQRLHDLNILSPVFYKMLEMLPAEEPSDQARYNWAEDDIPTRITSINHGGGYSAVAASIVVADASVFVPGTVILSADHDEIILVDTVTVGTNTLTITRGHQGSTAAILDDAEVLIDMGYSLGEGGNAPTAKHKIPTEVWNYIEMFSRTFDITELQNSTDMRYNVAKVSRETLEKAFEIRRDINEKLIYGLRNKGTNAAGETAYYTGGFYEFATENAITASKAALGWSDLWAFDAAYTPTSSSPRKALICGSGVYETLANIGYTNANSFYRQEWSSELGVFVMRIVLPSGNEIDVVKDRYTFDAARSRENDGILVDSRHVGLKWKSEWGLKWKQNIQDNDAHIRRDEIYGAVGFKLKHPDVHGTLTLT